MVNKRMTSERMIAHADRYGMEDFKNVVKIDAHAHINTEDNWMIDEARVNNFRVLIIAVDVAPEYPPIPEQLRVRKKHRREHPDVLAYTTTFSLDGWDKDNWSEKVIGQLRRDFMEGAVGVKVWKNIGMEARDRNGKMIMLDDPKFDPVFQFIQSRNKVLVSHAGEPRNCWLPLQDMTVLNDRKYYSEHPEYHMYLHPELPSYQDQLNARDNMLIKNMDLTFVGAHLASLEWSVDKITTFLDRFPNASVDLAERISHIQYQSHENREKVRKFIFDFQDRILYGTDLQQLEDSDETSLRKTINERWQLDWQYFNTDDMMRVPELDFSFQGLGLPKNVVDKIYRLNAERIFANAWIQG
jgi:hypothetical protein